MIKLLRNDLDPNVRNDFPFEQIRDIFNTVSFQEHADASYNAYFFEMCLLEILKDQQDT